jgi:peroxiredoxin
MSLASRLIGSPMPKVSLASTGGRSIDMSLLGEGRTVVYCYPRTSEPGKPAPTDWDIIPGARGCTPQSCSFRDHHAEIKKVGAAVFGLSTQTTAYQQEMVSRLHLPFEVLSDEHHAFCEALSLPTFIADGMRLIERMTLIVKGGGIEHVFYPIPRPEENASEILEWLTTHS